MTSPFQKDEQLLADIRRCNRRDGQLRLWWLGQSGFLLQWMGRHLLLDPYLSDSLTHKYAHTDKPHIRMTERVIAPECLDFIDGVTSSHNHTDHLDADTLRPLIRVNPGIQLIIPEANRDFVAGRIQMPRDFPIGLDAGQCAQVAGFRITAVPAAHEELEQDEAGRHTFLGYVVQAGNWCVYHSGDTLWYEGLLQALQPFRIDVALLPINGRDPRRRVAGNLGPAEAAELGKQTGARCVIPCHYDMFTFNTADPQEFVREARARNQPFSVLKNGQGWSTELL